MRRDIAATLPRLIKAGHLFSVHWVSVIMRELGNVALLGGVPKVSLAESVLVARSSRANALQNPAWLQKLWPKLSTTLSKEAAK